jgi:hypothetical protein
MPELKFIVPVFTIVNAALTVIYVPILTVPLLVIVPPILYNPEGLY